MFDRFVLECPWYNTLWLRVKYLPVWRLVNIVGHDGASSPDGRAAEEAPSCEGGVHVLTCRCTPHLTCVSLSSNGSLATHQVWTQSAPPYARYGKWKTGLHVRTCRCTPPLTCVKHLSNGSLVTHKIWTQSAQLFTIYGREVCTCARADALHLRHV